MPILRKPILRGEIRERGRGNRLSYRLDLFLALNPGVQLLAVLAVALVVAFLFGAALVWADGGDDTVGEGLWWALTRMLDGGSVAADAGLFRRAFGVAVTLVGMLSVAVITGAFASSFADRLRALRAGTVAIYERDHVLFVGWSPRGAVVLRELAYSGLRATIVILADEERELVEERVREALAGQRHRLRVIVRRGDPTATATLLRVAAHHARAALILAEEGGASPAPSGAASGPALASDRTDRAMLRALLALRRVVGRGRVPTVVEVSSQAARELVRLCAPGGDVAVVDAHSVNAHLLVHLVRQPGAFGVVRQILSLDARSIYLQAAERVVGRTFDEAHAAIDSGVLVGLLRDRTPMLCPKGAELIKESDRLLLFADDGADPSYGGKLPSSSRPSDADARAPATDRKVGVAVVHAKSELASLLRFLEAHCAGRITVLVPPAEAEEASAAMAHAALQSVSAEVVVGDPLDPAVLERVIAAETDVALLLAPDVSNESLAAADADQLITLLQLRRLGRRRNPPLRVVVEVRSPETERVAGPHVHGDFVLSREIVGMLLAQELHALCRDKAAGAWLGDVYERMLESITATIHLRPIALYAGGQGRATFADVAAAARRRGEVAIGVVAEDDAPDLLPRRDALFDVAERARVVVIGAHP